MPGLQSSPGHAGALGALRFNGSRNVLGDAAFHPDVDPGRGGWWANLGAPEAAVESDSASPRLFGSFGMAGAAFVPDLRGIAEPARLPGPIQFVGKLLEFWRLEDGDAVRLLGFDEHDADYVASVLTGGQPFRGRDVRERIAHLFRIRSILSALFRDRETENGWLRERHSLLHDRVPMDLMLGGSMEDLLLVRDYVERAAGW